MTFSPLPADPGSLLRHLGNEGLLSHIRAALDLLHERGVKVPPVLFDELVEAQLESMDCRDLDRVLQNMIAAPSG